MKFLSDRLLLTGYGSAPPIAVPEHGVYLPRCRTARRSTTGSSARDPARPTAAILFYRAHRAQRQHRVRRRAGRRARSRAASTRWPSSRRACARCDDGVPAALQLIDGRADVHRLDAVVRAGRVSPAATSEPRPVFERLGVPDRPGDHERHAARSVGSVAPRLDGARHRHQRRDSGVRRPDRSPCRCRSRIARDGRAWTLRAASAIGSSESPASRARWRGSAHLPRADDARRVRPDQLLVESVTGRQRRRSRCAREPADLLRAMQARRLRDRRGCPTTSDELMADLLARGSYDDHHPLDPGRRRMRFATRALQGGVRPAAGPRRASGWTTGGGRRRTTAIRSRDPIARVDKKIASKAAKHARKAARRRSRWSDDRDYLFAALRLRQRRSSRCSRRAATA